MLLALDVGNTHIVIGILHENELLHTFRIKTDSDKTEHEYALMMRGIFELQGLALSDFEGAIISSVVPEVAGTLSKAMELLMGVKPLVVGRGVKTGVNILIDDPATAGADLIVAAAGALGRYTPPMILVDLGTASTITVIDEKGNFRGGAIVPGVRLSLDALSAGTAQLPFIRLEAPKKAIGTNTVESMQSGSIFGTAAMIDGMIDRMEKELGMKTTVIATGGLAGSIVPNCTHEITVDDNLLLRGLAIIWAKNRK